MRDTPAFARDRDLCRNFLCILESLDLDVLVKAGVLDQHDHDGWLLFRDHTFRTYRHLDDDRQRRCFDLVQGRLTERLRSDVVDRLVSYRAAHETPGWEGDAFSFGARLSDAEVAGKVRMLMRDDLDHEAVCTMARDRIRDLSRELAAAQARIVELEGHAA